MPANMTRFRILILGLLMAGATPLFSQQDVMISQYLFNGLLINPGCAGSTPTPPPACCIAASGTRSTLHHQVVAVDGALRDNSMGVGLLMLHDQIGLTTQTDVALIFAYRIRLGAGRLAFGLRGGLSNARADLFAANLTEPGDPNYSENLQITQSARFGFGAYYHMQRFYCGVSIPTLTEFGETARQAEPHVLTTAGVVIKASDGVMLKPSFLAKYVGGAPISWDLNFHALFQERICRCGLVRRRHRQHDGNPRDFELRIGYAHDFTLSDIRNYSTGSNEILIGFDFGQGISAKRSPRYF